MSWIHDHSREDYTFYLRCAAKYELIHKTISRMEWRLDDFFSDGLLRAFENTLAARSMEISEQIDKVDRKQDFPTVLTQMLDASEAVTRDYLSSVIDNANSQLLKLRLGENALPIQEDRTIDIDVARLMLNQQSQHMSEDDLSFQMASVFGSIVRVIDDLKDAQSDGEHFKEVKNVRSFKRRIKDLQESCALGEGVIEAWIKLVLSHVIISRHSRYEHITREGWVKIWMDIFRCLGFISNSLHGLIILSEADAHGDWDNEKRDEWLEMLSKRFDKGWGRLEKLLFEKAGWTLGALSNDIK